MKEPIFILGISRTGSKIYMSILNKYSDINITPELNFINSSWRNFFFHKDFLTTVKKNIGDLKDDTNIQKLIDLMYSGKLEGSFWNLIKKRNLDKKTLKDRLINSDRTFKSVFQVLLEEHARSNNKKIPGAKFPVNPEFTSKLLKWYPSCKIVFLIRDPRAVYSSLSAGFSKKLNSKYKVFTLRIIMFLITINQFKKAVKIIKMYSNLANFCYIRFEDLITHSEIYIQKLCEFLEIEFKSDMLSPSVFDSSYKTNKKKGFDQETLHRWKKHISPITANMIKLFTNKQMKEIEYT
jgi:hypothetical protein